MRTAKIGPDLPRLKTVRVRGGGGWFELSGSIVSSISRGNSDSLLIFQHFSI